MKLQSDYIERIGIVEGIEDGLGRNLASRGIRPQFRDYTPISDGDACQDPYILEPYNRIISADGKLYTAFEVLPPLSLYEEGFRRGLTCPIIMFCKN